MSPYLRTTPPYMDIDISPINILNTNFNRLLNVNVLFLLQSVDCGTHTITPRPDMIDFQTVAAQHRVVIASQLLCLPRSFCESHTHKLSSNLCVNYHPYQRNVLFIYSTPKFSSPKTSTSAKELLFHRRRRAFIVIYQTHRNVCHFLCSVLK